MTIGAFHFIIFSLAVFRLTHLIVYDRITDSIRNLFITYEEETDEHGTIERAIVIAESGWRKRLGELLSCHWCVGIWCSFFLLIGYLSFPYIFSVVIFIFAAAGVAAIIESIVIQYL
ncbi:MAG: DUF1360 domain-containing protein [Bacillus sp. (in: Bacteria)]|nr:DUF1360 domain-containing protein [Bacillus sp. (in: firmicutes)]